MYPLKFEKHCLRSWRQRNRDLFYVLNKAERLLTLTFIIKTLRLFVPRKLQLFSFCFGRISIDNLFRPTWDDSVYTYVKTRTLIDTYLRKQSCNKVIGMFFVRYRCCDNVRDKFLNHCQLRTNDMLFGRLVGTTCCNRVTSVALIKLVTR